MRTHTITLLFLLSIMFMACSQNEVDEDKSGVVGSTLNAMTLGSSEGASLVKRKCASCHYLDRNLRKIGPSLKGIMGKAPSIKEIPFEIWTEEAMDRWIENPRSIKKKTKMAIPGIKNAEERKAIITYLKLL
ncbi:MAG: c-type cytochrome [Mariprofundaceae bacterium]